MLFSCLAITPTWAQQAEIQNATPMELEYSRGLVFLENHGHFRVRSSYFSEPGLDANELPLLYRGAFSSGTNAEYDETSWGSDLRFRYEPQLHISDNFTLFMTADLLKDMRFGATSRNTTQGGLQSIEQDSFINHGDETHEQISIARLYGEWEPVSGFNLRVGRMPAHFGLGIEENSGDCDDCDQGTVVDGFDAKANTLGTGIRIAWWWPAEGATTAYKNSTQGQPYDLSDLDDVSEWLFEFSPFSSGKIADQEKEDEARKNRGWLFDWAARFKWRTAHLQSDRFPKGVPCQGSAPGPDTPYDCLSLIPRNLDLWTPGFFLQLRGWPRSDRYVELGFELQAKLGSMSNVFDTTPEPGSSEEISTSREIEALGAAFQGSFSQGAWTVGLRSGLATGDSEGSYFGVHDGSNTVPLEQESQAALEKLQANHTFEQFTFHHDFITDVLLFREVIGAVTNTAFVRPEVKYRFNRGGNAFTVAGGLLAAWALTPETTPGKSTDYGIEADLKLSYLSTEHLKLVWTLAGLKPGQALAMEKGGESPPPLFTTQLDLFISF